MRLGRFYRQYVDWHAMKDSFRRAANQPLFDSAARECTHDDHVRFAALDELVDHLMRWPDFDPRR